jgi:hypothetical protein
MGVGWGFACIDHDRIYIDIGSGLSGSQVGAKAILEKKSFRDVTRLIALSLKLSGKQPKLHQLLIWRYQNLTPDQRYAIT